MKKLLLALALLICVPSVTLDASDLSNAERTLKSTQKELSSVTSKRDKAQKKQNQLQTDYEEALAKVAANQDKPKSLAYKDAVKKSEALPAKLEQNAQLLASLNRQVDSLQNIISGLEPSQTQAQQEEAKEDVAAVEHVPEPIIEPVIEQPIEKADKRETIELLEGNESKESVTSNDKAYSSSKPTTFWGKVWRVIKIIFWIFIGIIVLIILMKIRSRSGNYSRSSSGSSRSSSISSGSSDKENKRRQIAAKKEEIARQQEKILRLKDSINSRKRYKDSYRDLQYSITCCKQKIASLKADIERIKAR